MLKKKIVTENHFPAQERRNAIEMTARFFVFIFKNSGQITDTDINLLYTLFENLFTQADISWELFVAEIIEKDFDLRPIVKYLRRNLIQLDKLRIIGNLIIMLRDKFSENENNRKALIDYSMQLGLNVDGIERLITAVTNSESELVEIQTVNPEYDLKYSLFTDFITLGTSNVANVRFRDHTKYSPVEVSFLYIDECLEGIRKMMNDPRKNLPVLNIGSEELISINDLTYMIANVAGKKININHIDGPEGVRGRNSHNKLIKKTDETGIKELGF
jgi:hypothetical protein